MNLRTATSAAFFFLLSAVGLNPATAADPIIVGVVHSPAFPTAESMKRSFEMAVEERNKAGGVKGRPLKLVYANDGLNNAGPVGYQHGKEKKAVESLRDDGAVMLMGGYSSANTIHTAYSANQLDVPFLVTTAADNQITQRGLKNVYRLNPPARDYAAGVEEWFNERIKPKSVAIVYEASRYGTDTAARMLSYCRKNGIKLTKLVPYQKDRVNATYLQRRLQPIQKNQPDAVFMVSYLDDAVLLVNALRELKIGALLVGAGGGFTDPRLIDRLGDSAEGITTAALWSPQMPYPGAGEYYNKYLKSHNEAPDYHGAEAYSAALVAADVLERAASLDPEGIRKSLDATDLETPFGGIRFRSYEKFERQNSAPTVVLKIESSEFKLVWPENMADARASIPKSDM